MSNAGIDWFSSGKKEGKERADAVIKRRNVAAAMVTDLDNEMADLRVSLELDAPNYQPKDLERVQKPFREAERVMSEIFTEVNLIMSQQIGERISEAEAYQLVQPAQRIEAMAVQVRQWLQRARTAKTELDKPRTEITSALDRAESKRLSAEATLTQSQNLVEEMKQAGAESSPQATAALLTAEREITAASTMVNAARQATLRNSFREALDLCQRALSMFDSGQAKLATVKLAGQDFQKASTEADDALQKALTRLQEAKAELTNNAALIEVDPNTFFLPAVQKIGEARRAFKANPPQAVSCYRLSNEALTLIDGLLKEARERVRRIRDGRNNARILVARLKDAVMAARVAINEKQAVPVKAKDLYTQARDERDRLIQMEIDGLSPDELEAFNSSASLAIKLAETALSML